MEAPMTDESAFLRNPHLDGSPFFWPEGPVAILCIHGFSATTVEVRSIASFFRDNGYTTLGPLLPGHGTSPTDLNRTGWRDWLGAAEASLSSLQKDYSKILVLGESMGALVALHLMATHSDLLGAMIFAPAVKIRNLWLSQFLWPFKESLKKGPPNADIPQQSYKVFPLKAAASLFAFQARIKRMLPCVKQPVLIFQGTKDRTIDPIGALYVYENIASTNKDLVILKESEHIILLDRQLPEVQIRCLEFIREQSGELT
jgi:carboxylesterase